MSRALALLMREQQSETCALEMLESLGLRQGSAMHHSGGGLLGVDVVPSELQQNEIAQLAARLKGTATGTKSAPGTPRDEGVDEDGDEAADEAVVDPASFDLLNKPRALVFDGKVNKRNVSAFHLKSKSKRRLFLLNDVLLVTSSKKKLMSKSEKFLLHNIIPLDEISVRSFWTTDAPLAAAVSSSDVTASPSKQVAQKQPAPIECVEEAGGKTPAFAFEIMSSDKIFQLSCESEAERRTWIEMLTSASVAYCHGLQQQQQAAENGWVPGWHHLRNRGTLWSACMRGEINEVAFLLKQGDLAARINAADDLGLSPLHWAALSGNCKIVALLVEAGADVNVLNNSLCSPLHLAAASGYTDIVLYLIERGADGTCKNVMDRDAAFCALLYAHAAPALSVVVEALVASGCNVNDVDCTGRAAIHEAACRGLLASIQVLHAQHCEMNKPPLLGDLHLRSPSISRLLSPSFSALSSPPASPTKGAVLQQSPARSPKPSSPVHAGKPGPTPLLMACSQQPLPSPEVVRVLLDNGAFPSARLFSSENGGHAGLSAIDLALRGFAERHGVSLGETSSDGVWVHDVKKAASLPPVGDKGERDCKETVASFVEECLPVCMELAKKGCRLPDSTLLYLRPSLADAIRGARHQWLYRKLDEECFVSLVEVECVGKQDDGWTHDSASSACLCCGEGFSLTTRRHHCRSCGVLCCAACSGRTLPAPASAGAAAGEDKKGLRVCDGCFNAYLFLFDCRSNDALKFVAPTPSSLPLPPPLALPPIAEHGASDKTIAKEEGEGEGEEGEGRGQGENEAEASTTTTPRSPLKEHSSAELPQARKASLFSWGGSASPTKAAASQAPANTTVPASSATASAAAEALEALQLRGQKLNELQERSAEMQAEAHDFQDAAAQLRSKMAKKAGLWGVK